MLNQASVQADGLMWHPKCMRTHYAKKNEMSPDIRPSINIRAISLITRKHGTDIINFEVDLPSPFPNCHDPTYITMNVASGHGQQYIEDNFAGMPFTKIEG